MKIFPPIKTTLFQDTRDELVWKGPVIEPLFSILAKTKLPYEKEEASNTPVDVILILINFNIQ